MYANEVYFFNYREEDKKPYYSLLDRQHQGWDLNKESKLLSNWQATSSKKMF